MKSNMRSGRRTFLGFLTASPWSLASIRGEAQPRTELNLFTYFALSGGKSGRLFADKVAEKSAGTIRVSADVMVLIPPFQRIGRASAFASYIASEFASIEPVLGLSALPMLTATFDEAETLARIARPYYDSALARYGQILLATEPWQPTALWSTFPIRSNADLKGVPFALSLLAEQMGWKKTLVRLGARHSSFSDAELMLSVGYDDHVRFTREFAYLTETFLAVPLKFLTAGREVFESLTEAQRGLLVETGRDTEAAFWKANRELLHRNHQDATRRGVSLIAPGSDVLTALRIAAAPDIQAWVESMGADGSTILSQFRRAVGHE